LSLGHPKRFEHVSLLQRLRLPWILESILFWLILWQESARLSWRTAQTRLPIGDWLQNFYYYNFGDFVNGYGIAFIVDGLVNLIFLRKRPEISDAGRKSILEFRVVIFAGVLSVIIITVFEVGRSSAFTTADIADIPAGFAGAILYCVIRIARLRTNSLERETEVQE